MNLPFMFPKCKVLLLTLIPSKNQMKIWTEDFKPKFLYIYAEPPSLGTDYDNGTAGPAAEWKAFLSLKSYLNIILKGFYLYYWNPSNFK